MPIKIMVFPLVSRCLRESASIFLSSAVVKKAAFKYLNSAFIFLAIINPKVVFPVPEGPYKIKGGIKEELMTRLSNLPSFNIWS